MASKLILVTLCLAAVIAAASARPRFLAIPIEDIQFVSGPSSFNPAHHRVARQANTDHHEPVPAASGGYPSGGSDAVDYGAYTGSHGAFGWYSDHPVGNYGSSY
ncbi:hypothetical protein GHT06_020617 [Daphnia sinensis]|uniref:Uncharacterized protein n=1 Tax=Daphnia sinensis TaxID=1820382 RepID=A0AAD5PN27_9CRUS|nr:hypothetical protein GHT06_020617 [Daphnia sinensis]